MRIFDLNEYVPECEKYSVALGNFDGVHIAHAALLEQAMHSGIKSGVFLFKGNRKNCISTFDEKLEIIENAGIDTVFICNFDDVKNMCPNDFVVAVLKKIGCAIAICGFNYRFGKDALGDEKLLGTLCAENGMECRVIPVISKHGVIVSSSEIRKDLSCGKIGQANEMLGRSFYITGDVLHGYEQGRKISIPTLNIKYPAEKIMLQSGVYITTCEIDGVSYPSVTNVGTNPTLQKDFVTCETYLLDASGDFYGMNVKINFDVFRRNELKFDNINELKPVIEADIRAAREYYGLC